MAQRIPLDRFKQTFGHLVELSSESLGGRVLSCSDEFFAPASDLIKVAPAVSHKGTFKATGAVFDGWETRRHNPTHDWAIIKLGPPSGTITGVDIDTAHFNGNEGPAGSVAACFLPDRSPEGPNDPAWKEILPISKLGPSSSHLFTIPSVLRSQPFTHVKLMMHPDGGIARFRVYGSVIPIFPSPEVPLDLAHSFNGGRVVAISDQHYGVGANLLLSGRGKDMGDGWETKRSRVKGHTDWVIVKLGAPGYLDWTEIDTAHFLGNFPESVDLYATNFDGEIPSSSAKWEPLLPRTKTGPHRQHCLQLERTSVPTTHVRMTIYPDGGIKRLRLVGRRAVSSASPPSDRVARPVLTEDNLQPQSRTSSVPTQSVSTDNSLPLIPALPLTSEAFARYGYVIQSYPNTDHVPKGLKVTDANFGSAKKYNHLSPITALPPPKGSNKDLKHKENFSVYRCTPTQALGTSAKEAFKVEVLERHEYTSQTFLPLGAGADRYLVIVALPGKDGKPDLQTLRAFTATSAQGFTYKPNVWHHPMIALDATTDFACITNELGNAKLDCEILEYGKAVALVTQAFISDHSATNKRPSKL